jgi:hypothetical protein
MLGKTHMPILWLVKIIFLKKVFAVLIDKCYAVRDVNVADLNHVDY